jgi:hypothetical protein
MAEPNARPASPLDPRLVDRAQAQIAHRRLRALGSALDEHAEWAGRQLPRSRRHDQLLHWRVRRIGESIDLNGGS